MTENTDRILNEILLGNIKDVRDRYHIGKVLMRTLTQYGERINQIDVTTGESETHESVLKRSIKCAIWLKENGIEEGDVIMVSSTNHLDSTIPVVAAMFIGAIIFPIDVNLKAADVPIFLNVGKPKMIFCDITPILSNMESAIATLNNFETRIITYGATKVKQYTSFSEAVAVREDKINEFRVSEFDPESTTAFILCTSGSTGFPKGVMVAHKAFIFRLMNVWHIPEYPYTNHRIIAVSSLHWYSGAANLFTSCIFGATKLQSYKQFTIDIYYKTMREYKPTLTILNPAYLLSYIGKEEYANVDWSTVKIMLIGGSVVPPSLYKLMSDKLVNGKILPLYGCSETSGVVTYPDHQPCEDVLSIGRAIKPTKIKLVDQSGQEVGPTESGEAYIQCPFNSKGYYNDPENTKNSFTEDGSFKSGDILKRDENGYFYFVDRLKSIMKYGNNQISPAEIEIVIQAHPAVELVIVERYEIPPDDYAVALIVKKPYADVSAQEIMDLVKENLAPFKQLHGGVFFLDSLPFVPSGKLDRVKCRAMVKTLKDAQK